MTAKSNAREGDGVAELLAAAIMANGDHSAPHDCYATGPLTGDPHTDLVVCPGCRLAAAIAAMQPSPRRDLAHLEAAMRADPSQYRPSMYVDGVALDGAIDNAEWARRHNANPPGDQRQEGAQSFDFYWLVELFRPYGGNSLGQFEAPGGPTARAEEAYRYATRKDAEYAASKRDAGPDTEWRAAEHGFPRANPPGDQRQEGDSFAAKLRADILADTTLAASPPSEAAAAVGDLLDDVAQALANYSLLQKPDDRVGHRLTMDLRQRFRDYRAALASPTGPQAAGGGVDDAMVERIAELIAAEMPSETVIQRCVVLAVNKNALAAIKGDSHAG